ncbi:MAG: short-chain dehydrogenase, partial [Alphaproteobacteria bacterium]|nr:short-chain dehydrogenase [Alphaproteobacteria bacterium]MDX5415368.1 short-chain dehydrogenase [Alphaproteobacteria bacterium]MDX5492583.1 short-chain dehydrogenase [Alphaproteobacteria bacterium]
KTRIYESGRARQEKYGSASDERDPERVEVAKQFVLSGIDPDRVGARVVEAILDNELYIFTHPDMAPLFEARAAAIRNAFAHAGESPALKGVAYKSPEKIGLLDK